jgi:tetratricopeptide (TPR) repeat protein
MMGAIRKSTIAFVALAAALPAQAVQNARLLPMMAKAPTCYSGVGGPDIGEESPPVLIPGLGTPTGLVPDTANAEARKWFEQGMLLVWAYDEAEAIRAFRKAQQIDGSCALCHWGEALARSPTLNLQPPNVDLHSAAAASARAVHLAGGKKLDRIQSGLIEAMRIRAPGTSGSFDFEGYVQAMAALAKEAPESDPVLVLAADSQIVRWSATEVPLQGAQGWLETVLKRSPNHTGAIHFYIHLADIVGRPQIAFEAAGRLGRYAPAASHLVHMPSHSFYGTGDFRQAVAVNRNAIRAYLDFEKLGPAVSGYRRYLFAHDHHYAIESALMNGDGSGAVELAEDFGRRFPAQDPLFRVRPAHYAAPWYAYGRHLPVDKMLAMTEPMLGESDAARTLSRVMWRYARGEALARQDESAGLHPVQARKVAEEASQIAALMAGPLASTLDPESRALALMAQHVLEGRSAMLMGEHDKAEAAYRLAMNLRFDSNLQFDPPPFWYGVRRSLAAAILAKGDAAGAERQLNALFATWPNDPLGLLLYSQAEAALGRPESAAKYLSSAQARWAGGDIGKMQLPII